jgi:hypothetical protein
MRILVLTRKFFGWTQDAASYEDAIDHRRHEVIYLANADGVRGLSSAARTGGRLFELPSLDKQGDVLLAVERIVRLHGRPDRVLALHEDDLLTAAAIRDRYGIRGRGVRETLPFRDKVLMKDRVLDAGLAAPRFLPATEAARAAELGFPLVLKPRAGSSSRGVQIIPDAAALRAALVGIDLEQHEIEEFVEGPILHLDGIVQDGRLAFFQPFRYVGSCLGFATGDPVGVVMATDPDLRTRLADFALKVFAALGLDRSAFHLEVILKNGVEPVFLEMGARVGGAFVPNTVHRIHGVSLVDEAIRLELDPDYQVPVVQAPAERAGGWLLFPDPPQVPVRVLRSMSLAARFPEIYREMVPRPGDVLDGRGGYIRTAGTFLLEADSETALVDMIGRAVPRYRIEWDQVGPLASVL